MSVRMEVISALVKHHRILVRVGLSSGEITPWSRWISEPSPSYLEVSQYGPIEKAKVQWLEVNCIETKNVGRLVEPKRIGHSAQVYQSLEKFSIEYDQLGDSKYRIVL